MNWTAERLAKLRLARTTGIGPLTFQKLLSTYASASEAIKHLPDRARQAGKRSLEMPSPEQIEREVSRTESYGAKIVFPGDDDYPRLLSELTPPPPVLTCFGNTELAQRDCVSIVGARNASAAGIKIAAKLAQDLGEAGWTIVSGLARGIDTAAHRASLQTGTIAVIAGGIDNIYPPQNQGLYEKISHSGLIISENPFGFDPRARDFPRRNRLVTGLSLGVVIIEAAEKSGTLISARTALEQGREVMAVPGSPLDPRSKGSNGLIRKGAVLVESAAHILEILSPMQAIQDDLFRFSEPEADIEDDPARDIEPDSLLSFVSPVSVSIRDLADAAGLSQTICSSLLVDLELSGKVRTLPGGLVQRVV